MTNDYQNTLAQRILECAEDGKVAVIESGMDCDGVRYSGNVSILDATFEAVNEHIEYQLSWADGPMYHHVERPSVAQGVQPESEDLGMQAFEDGHPHVIRTGAASRYRGG